MHAFSIRECLTFGWKTFLLRPWTYVGAVLIMWVVQVVVTGIQQGFPEPFIGFVISLAASTLLYCGALNFFIKAHDAPEQVALRNLWYPKVFFRYLLLSILLGIMIGVGLVLLIVPGIILGLMFFCAGYLTIEKNLGPIEALKESARITRGSRWRLFLLVLAMALLFVVGMIPLFLGLLVVAPIIALAGVHAYRALLQKEAAPVAVPASST